MYGAMYGANVRVLCIALSTVLDCYIPSSLVLLSSSATAEQAHVVVHDVRLLEKSESQGLTWKCLDVQSRNIGVAQEGERRFG
jgi:hypothetical protein